MKPALVLLFAALAGAITCTDPRGEIWTAGGGALVSECSVGVNCPPLARCDAPGEAGTTVVCDVLGQWTWRCELPAAAGAPANAFETAGRGVRAPPRTR